MRYVLVFANGNGNPDMIQGDNIQQINILLAERWAKSGVCEDRWDAGNFQLYEVDEDRLYFAKNWSFISIPTFRIA